MRDETRADWQRRRVKTSHQIFGHFKGIRYPDIRALLAIYIVTQDIYVVGSIPHDVI